MYECFECKHNFEVSLPVDVILCPLCGSDIFKLIPDPHSTTDNSVNVNVSLKAHDLWTLVTALESIAKSSQKNSQSIIDLSKLAVRMFKEIERRLSVLEDK